ncbi:MAG TPA: hypothetical protein VFE62_24525, partial [Gemmataceae bacterium]|nr:hypothetical protein [Gemmataceae bacterium]
PTLNVKFQNEYAKIAKEMEEQRVTEKIPEEFKKMRELANPQKMLQQEASSATSRPELHMPKLQAPGGPVRMPDAVPQGPVSGLQAPTEGKK